MEDQDQASETVKMHALKCVTCGNELQKPVQLSECLHIVCLPCVDVLKGGKDPKTVVCSRCDSENINPKVLHRISGLNLKSPEAAQKMCDVCKERPSTWTCFHCNDSLCSACRAHHQRDHAVYLLFNQSLTILRASSPTENSGDQADSGNVFACPLCNSTETPCKHRTLFERLTSEVKKEVGYCTIPTHVINNETDNPEPLRFFCIDHWKPVCGACSQLGTHKLCNTPDIMDVVPNINKGIDKTLEYRRMLLHLCQEELNEKERSENKLRRHVRDVEEEIDDRRKRILYHFTKAMDEIVSEARTKGNGILDRYKGEVRPFMEIRSFLEGLESPLTHIKEDTAEVDISKYVNSFELLEATNESLKELENFLKKTDVFKDERFEEMRLVLPSVPYSISVPPLLYKVGSEHRHPQHLYTIELDIQYYVDSFIVTGLDEGIYTEKRSNEKYGRMMKFAIKEKKDENNKIVPEVTKTPVDIPQGKYYMAQLKSQEIVASRATDGCEEQEFDLIYCSKIPKKVKDFKIIYQSPQPLGGTAVTADNNVFVCVDFNAECKKVEPQEAARSFLRVISLQGKVIKESLHNLQSPKHVAVSDHGEIAISDSDRHCVVIMNSDLEEIDRVDYFLPTSMSNSELFNSDDQFFFYPEGICYDSYGRILVTDSRNNCIVRLSRNAEGKFIMEPLIVHRQDLKDFVGPHLVAIGPGQRLWVVCRRMIYIFDYQSL